MQPEVLNHTIDHSEAPVHNQTIRNIAIIAHVDHGKTALVRALTGTDTDRLPEEKQRGISIALGFAHLEDLGPEELNGRFFEGRADALEVGRLGRVLSART